MKTPLMSKFATIEQISLTTDIWTSCNNTPYIVYINRMQSPDQSPSFLKQRCLACHSFMTTDNNKFSIKNSIPELSIKEKVVAITTDNANVMIRAVKNTNIKHIG
uniref:Zinc finger BED domaincontaining protein 1like [Oryzias latipes] n=1 Tax=Lepeophtheirus salmonis TaxID=72036 RepID=A0A0K2TQ69_LEPSM